MTLNFLYYIDNTFKEQRIIANDISKESLPANNIQNIAKRFVGVDSSLIMKCESRLYERQNKYLATLKDTVWPSSAHNKRHYNPYTIDYDNHVSVRVNPRFEINNDVQVNRLKLYRSENRIDIGKLHDGKLREAALEKLPLKATKIFKQTFPERTFPEDTIYLYDNRTFQCVIN